MPKNDSQIEWTWARGMRRATGWATLAALVMAAGLGVAARYWPILVLNVWVRLLLAFLVAWLLFAVVHRTAGMAGGPCTAEVVVLTAAVFLSQHWVFATYGVPTVAGRLITGNVWFDPTMIMATESTACVGLVFAVMLCHDGGSVWRTVVDMLSAHLHG